MVNIWNVFWSFCGGCIFGFFLYGCIDWRNNNFEKDKEIDNND